MRKIGIIAGKGKLPSILVKEAAKRGYHVIVIALDPVADSADESAAEVSRINIGKLGKIIKTMKAAGVKEAVMAGKVSKRLLYEGGIQPDLLAMKLLFKIKDRKDDTILQAFTDELESHGITVMKIMDLASDLIMPSGSLAGREPTPDERENIDFGFAMAREIGRLDIGQTVVVKNKAVMAVEAIEGTDEAILRGGRLAKGGAVVVKVSKPQQDMRYDVPAIGIDTLRSMLEVKAGVLAAEAGRSLIIQKDEVVAFAEENGILIAGV